MRKQRKVHLERGKRKPRASKKRLKAFDKLNQRVRDSLNMAKSPLTNYEAEYRHEPLIDWHHYSEDIGEWAISDTCLDYGFKLGSSYKNFTQPQTESIIAVAISKIWRAKRLKQKKPLIVTAEALGGNDAKSRGEIEPYWQLFTPEALFQENEQLSLQKKAMETLTNFVLCETRIGDGVQLGIKLKPYPGGYAQAKIEGTESSLGLIYGCTANEALLILQYLVQERFLTVGEDSGAVYSHFYLTPNGYLKESEIRAGHSFARSHIFMVCRFVDDFESVFTDCIRPLGELEDVRCAIVRVKDVHSIEKIDDQILRMIDEASVVLVDLTDHSFNVAFEAGYALSKGKPIVWSMKKPEGRLDLPFDIQSHNIILWEEDKLDEFKTTLHFRLLAAFDSLVSK